MINDAMGNKFYVNFVRKYKTPLRVRTEEGVDYSPDNVEVLLRMRELIGLYWGQRPESFIFCD